MSPPFNFYIYYTMPRKVIKAERKKEVVSTFSNENQDASLDSMERLARIMNDSPSLVKLAGTEWEVRALKPAVQWKISELACKIKKNESETFSDILKDIAQNVPTVVEIITLALLNDKKRIDEEFESVYNTLLWEGDVKGYGNILFEILNLQDVGFFLQIKEVIEIFRQTTLQKKTMMKDTK